MRKPLTQRQNRALRRRASKIRKKTVKANKNAKLFNGIKMVTLNLGYEFFDKSINKK